MLVSLAMATAPLLLSDLVKLPSSRPLIATFFQEDCRACRKQQKELLCFADSGWSVVIVGVGDNHVKLRQEALRDTKGRLTPQFISWEAARRLSIQGTPTSFVWEAGGQPRKLAGLLSCPRSADAAVGMQNVKLKPE